jgi:DNA polymerase-3 subunit delta
VKPAELTKELAAGKIRPAYLVAGAEPLLRDDSVAALRAAVLGGAPADWNLDRLAGEKTSAGALEDALRALPVMAERRLVILSEPERRRGGAAAALTEAIAAQLPALAAQPGSVLVVVAEKADRRARWVKAFAEPCAWVECDAPTQPRALAAFAEAEAARQGVAIERDACALLVERVGAQLAVLRQEIAKLGLLAGEGERVTSEHVALATASVAEQPIWDWTDAIGAGETARALEILARLLESGAAPPMLLGVLAGHFRKLVHARAGGAVAGPPFVVRKLGEQARRYSLRGLRGGLDRIHAADVALKGASPLPPELVLEDLLLDLVP